MATVLQGVDPMSVASSAVGSFYDAKRKKETEDAAAAYQASRDTRSDMESDRTFGLAQNRDTREGVAATDAHALEPGKLTEQTDTHQKSASELVTSGIKQKMDLQTMAYQRAKQPLELEYQRLQNKHESGEILSQSDTHQLSVLEQKIKTIDAQYEAQNKALAAALKQAQITHENASTSHENAETQKTLRGPAGAKPSEGERETGAYNAASAALTPQGQQFRDILYGTNNQPTKAQAMLALSRSQLSPIDKQNLATMIESKQSQFVTPGSQVSGERADVNAAATATNRQEVGTRITESQKEKRGEAAYNAIKEAPAFKTLPPRLSNIVQQWMVSGNFSVEDILQHLPTADKSVPDAGDKQAIKQALGGK